MSETARLKEYYDFNDEVVSSVEETAELQDELSFRELADAYGIGGGPQNFVDPRTGKAFDVLTFRPLKDYDHTHARVYHLPMAMPVDESMTARCLRLFGADQDSQMIVIGNPAALGHKTGKISLENIPNVYAGNLAAAVSPTLRYLETVGVTSADHIGYSYGAERAVTAAAEGQEMHDIETEALIAMEPVSVKRRGLLKLLGDFASSGSGLQAAVEASASASYNEARQQADSGFIRYAAGLLRLSNVAIAHGMTNDLFEARLDTALEANNDTQALIAWGSESEITDTEKIVGILDHIGEKHEARVRGMMLEGMRHAGGDDINLHAAIVLQSYALMRGA